MTAKLPIFIENATYRDHAIITNGQHLSYLLCPARLVEYPDNNLGDFGKRLAAWDVSPPTEFDEHLDAIAAVLRPLPARFHTIQLMGAYTRGRKEELPRLKALFSGLRARGITIGKCYIDWEHDEEDWRQQLFIDYYQNLISDAGSSAKLFTWSGAKVNVGYANHPIVNGPFDAACSHFPYTTPDQETTDRMDRDLPTCPGPKYVTLSAAALPAVNTERLAKCRRYLNPTTDGVIIFTDDNTYDGHDTIQPGLGGERLTALIPVVQGVMA
jgi:hypothetical protein